MACHFYYIGTKADIRDKMAIHQVEVEFIGTCRLSEAAGIGQISIIGSQK